MTTATQPAKARPAMKRWLNVLEAFNGTNRITIRISQQRGNGEPEVTDYSVEFVPADASMGAIGATFRKVFQDTRKSMVAQSYTVLINSAGIGIACDCTGSQRYGKCKHRDIVPALLRLRKDV